MLHLSTHQRYIALIALISAVILVLGVWLKPKQLPQPTISAEEIVRLQTLTQRRNLENRAVYFSQIAGNIQPGLVWLNEIAKTGLVWNEHGLIVTTGLRRSTPAAVTALTTTGEITMEARVRAKGLLVSSLEAPAGTQLEPVRKRSGRELTPGMPILEVARQSGGNFLFLPGIFGGFVRTRCAGVEYRALESNLPLTESALGGGLFDIDGNLLAMVVRCDDRVTAVTPSGIDREIARASSFAGRLLADYGLEVSPLDDVSRKYFQVSDGAWVKQVMDGQPADFAGLVPGDVVTSLEAKPVRAPEDLRPLTSPGDHRSFRLEVWRNRRRVPIELNPNANQPAVPDEVAASAGILLASPAPGYVVESVARGSRADRASIQAGDRLLLVNGQRPASAVVLDHTLLRSARGPVFVVFRRETGRLGTFLD